MYSGGSDGAGSLALPVLCWFAFQCAALFRATVLALRERPIPASFAPLGVYIYAVGGESCRNRLTLEGSARLRPKTKPRSASSGTGLTAHAFVTPFGEKRDSSRALHPPSAARYFVGGIPPPCLACVRWRITRTVVAPFPCAHSSHLRRQPDLPLWRVSFRSFCARRLIVGSLNYL